MTKELWMVLAGLLGVPAVCFLVVLSVLSIDVYRNAPRWLEQIKAGQDPC